MIGSQRSRRVMAAILASPPRSLRLGLDRVLDARRATQAHRARQYRSRQARAIHTAASTDILMAEAAARA